MNTTPYMLCMTAVMACSSFVQAKSADSRPNIILMVADDHGKDALGCYGNPIIKTPHLDALAGRGVRYERAYCTSASSAASRSVLLTGQFGHAIGAYGHVHDYHHFSTFEHVRSLPVILEENGYHTARIGKYHVAPESVYHFQKTLQADPRNPVAMADACQGVINQEEPFFLYFCTDDPHRSDFTTASDDWRSPNLFGNKQEGYPGVQTIPYDATSVIVPPFLSDNPETRDEIAQYYESISRIDQGVGRLMSHLKASGKWDNTIVIYIADNGMAFPGAKTSVYEPGIQLPCIVADPTQHHQSAVSNALISWVDMTPTLLDVAGVDFSKEKFHGKSFAKTIQNPKDQGADRIFASHNFHEITMYYPMRVLREQRYKLIWNVAWELPYPFASDLFISSTWQTIYRNDVKKYGGRKTEDFLYRDEFELYDLEKDPQELENLANKRAYQEVLQRMQKELKDWQRTTRDPWFIMWDGDASLQGSGEQL